MWGSMQLPCTEGAKHPRDTMYSGSLGVVSGSAALLSHTFRAGRSRHPSGRVRET
jgi:hypothetical protein